MSDVTRVAVEYQFPFGEDRVEEDPGHPWARAVHRLATQGRPYERLANLYFREGSNDETSARWLGVMVLTAGGRLSLFPGAHGVALATKRAGIRTAWNGEFRVDHISLEQDRRSWHFTSARSAEHMENARTLDVGQGRVLWCSLQLRDSGLLRAVSRRLLVQHDMPTSDAERRIAKMTGSQAEIEVPVITVPDRSLVRSESAFLHFAFIVGPTGFPPYTGPQLGFPHGSPLLASPVPFDLRGLPWMASRVSLAPALAVDVFSCWLPGELHVPMMLTSPFAPQSGVLWNSDVELETRESLVVRQLCQAASDGCGDQ